jgi:hypothetical protein
MQVDVVYTHTHKHTHVHQSLAKQEDIYIFYFLGFLSSSSLFINIKTKKEYMPQPLLLRIKCPIVKVPLPWVVERVEYTPSSRWSDNWSWSILKRRSIVSVGILLLKRLRKGHII